MDQGELGELGRQVGLMRAKTIIIIVPSINIGSPSMACRAVEEVLSNSNPTSNGSLRVTMRVCAEASAHVVEVGDVKDSGASVGVAHVKAQAFALALDSAEPWVIRHHTRGAGTCGTSLLICR